MTISGAKQEGRRAGSAIGFKTESATVCVLPPSLRSDPSQEEAIRMESIFSPLWLATPFSSHLTLLFGILSHCGILAELEFHSSKQTSDISVSILAGLIGPWEGITRPGPLD